MSIVLWNVTTCFLADYIYQCIRETLDNDGKWRIKTKEELEILIKKKNIVIFIKSQRLRRAAHVVRMDTKRIVEK
jgi:hypothetical protein